MSINTQIKLSGTCSGRIILHVMSMKRDRKFSWHMKGIVREFRQKT